MMRVTAQVAVEAIVNMPDAFDLSTMETVLADADAAGVSGFYLAMLRATIQAQA